MTKDAAEGSRSTRFQPGQSGNPTDRLKAARNKLGEMVITDLYDAWQKHGADVIRRCMEENPAEVRRIAAALGINFEAVLPVGSATEGYAIRH